MRSMTRGEFEKIVAEVGLHAVPERFRGAVKNVAFLVEDEPSDEVREEEGLAEDETLFGLYRGVPHTERGELYGVGVTLPDTITLYQKPIEEEGEGDSEKVREIVCETIWHEVAHHFGLGHGDMRDRGHDA